MIGELILTGDTYNDGRIAINYAFSGIANFNGLSAVTLSAGTIVTGSGNTSSGL